jgi:hypothetical protein
MATGFHDSHKLKKTGRKTITGDLWRKKHANSGKWKEM